MINKIYQGIKRFFFGSTYKFDIRKGSTSFNGASWVEIYKELTTTPLKLISITFLMENTIAGEYRIVVNGEKIFPFNNFNQIENGTTKNFIVPINIAAGSFLQIEVKSGINNNNVIIMDEMAIIEVI
jgi:hypothetical protein